MTGPEPSPADELDHLRASFRRYVAEIGEAAREAYPVNSPMDVRPELLDSAAGIIRRLTCERDAARAALTEATEPARVPTPRGNP